MQVNVFKKKKKKILKKCVGASQTSKKWSNKKIILTQLQ